MAHNGKRGNQYRMLLRHFQPVSFATNDRVSGNDCTWKYRAAASVEEVVSVAGENPDHPLRLGIHSLPLRSNTSRINKHFRRRLSPAWMEFLNATSLVGAIQSGQLLLPTLGQTIPRRTIPVVHYTRISINRLSNNTRETRVWIIYYARVIPLWRSLLDREQRSLPLPSLSSLGIRPV